MLAIRMQRTGRKGHAMFRVIVQDSRLTPTSGKIVASLGNYDPHAQVFTLDKDKASFYLEHGAQPSDRIARLLKKEGVKLPKWVVVSEDLKRDIRNPDKRRSTRPAAPVVETPTEVVAETEPTVEVVAPAIEEDVTETPAEVVTAEIEPVAETTVASETEAVTEEVTAEETPAVEEAVEPTLEVATESPAEEATEATPEVVVEEASAEEVVPETKA